jgi:phosphoribosylamine--glycine ligase
VFLAGARRDPDGHIRTAGGRVLAVTGMGDDLAVARNAAYQAVANVCFESIDFRRDVGTL